MGHPYSEGLRLPLLSVNFCVSEQVSCAIGPMGNGACGVDGGAQGWCVWMMWGVYIEEGWSILYRVGGLLPGVLALKQAQWK